MNQVDESIRWIKLMSQVDESSGIVNVMDQEDEYVDDTSE